MGCDCIFDTDDGDDDVAAAFEYDNDLDGHADDYNNHVYYHYLGMTITLIITL